jgi:AcrR family transcriptional regulator
VSNRQVAEAAGQANTSAVAYHVGTKTDLILAIARGHTDAVTARARQMLDRAGDTGDPRDHVACLVMPYLDHLATLGTPSWCARFTAQITTDPGVRDLAIVAATSTPAMHEALTKVSRCSPRIPAEVAALRASMIRLLIVHTCAEQERDAADTGTPPDWAGVADALIDACTAVLLGPATAHHGRVRGS